MKKGKMLRAYILYIIIGIVLLILGLLDILDSFWSGMGGALIAVGAIRISHFMRYLNDSEYKEQQDIANKDERNLFLRSKAWAWTGYIFVLIAGILTIVFKLLGQDTLSQTCAYAVCLLVVIYWICYLIASKKY